MEYYEKSGRTYGPSLGRGIPEEKRGLRRSRVRSCANCGIFAGRRSVFLCTKAERSFTWIRSTALIPSARVRGSVRGGIFTVRLPDVQYCRSFRKRNGMSISTRRKCGRTRIERLRSGGVWRIFSSVAETEDSARRKKRTKRESDVSERRSSIFADILSGR